MQNYALNLGRIKGCLIVRDRECMNCFLRTGMEGMIVILLIFWFFLSFLFIWFNWNRVDGFGGSIAPPNNGNPG